MHDEPATPLRRNPLLVAAVAAVVLLLVALASGAPRPEVLEVLPHPTVTPSFSLPPMSGMEPAPSASPMPPSEEAPFEFPGWVDDAVTALLVSGALAVVVWFLLRLVAATRRPAHRAAVADGGRAVEIPDFDDEEMAQAVDDAVASLRRGIDVDDAVIECWRRLERVAAGSGIERRPEQTSHEFTADVLSLGSVDEAALLDLAGLYRVAMFSTHRLIDDDRERAIAALERLSGQLRGEVVDGD